MRTPSLLLAALTSLVAGCGTAPGQPFFRLSATSSTFDVARERLVVRVQALEADERPGTGTVSLHASLGQFVTGEVVTLQGGFASATFACDPVAQPACVGPITLWAEWQTSSSTVRVTGTRSDAPTPVQWEVVPTLSLATLSAAAVAPDGKVWAVGENGTALVLSGKVWSPVETGVAAPLRALAFGAGGQVVVVGDDVVLTATGAGFTVDRYADRPFTSVAISASGVFVGDSRGLISKHVPGRALTSVLDLRQPVQNLVASDGGVWAIGSSAMARGEALSWQAVTAPPDVTMLFGQAGKAGLLIGGSRAGSLGDVGALFEGPGADWTTTQLDAPVRAVAEVPESSERFAVTDIGLFRQQGQAPWALVSCPMTAQAVVSRGPKDVVLVGPPGVSLLRVK